MKNKTIETTRSLKAECEERGLNYSAVTMRINSGWSREKALSTPINSQKKYMIYGKPVGIKEFCKENNLDYYTVRNRIHQSGMSFEDAIDMTKGKLNRRYTLNGRDVSVKQECKNRGLNYSTVMVQLSRGKTVKEVLVTIPKKNQERKKLQALCKKKGVKYSLYMSRIAKGWSVKEALINKNKN